MSGSLAIQAAGGAAATVEIDGVILNGVPTWVVGNNAPANSVAVKPGDTVIWKAVGGTHGVLFDPSVHGLGYGLAFSNDQNVPISDPQTPLFRAAAGTPVRFRLVMPSTSTSKRGSPRWCSTSTAMAGPRSRSPTRGRSSAVGPNTRSPSASAGPR